MTKNFTEAADLYKGGIHVTRPPRNTKPIPYREVIYHGFDKLELSYKGAVGQRILDLLAEAKQRAEETNEEAVITFDEGRKILKVAAHGLKNGYRYLTQTGEQEYILFIKNSGNLEGWNLRISISSLALSTKGHLRCFEEIDEWLEALEFAYVGEQLITSFGRIDYCIDIHLEKDFEFKKANFVLHSRGKISENVRLESQANRSTGITIGRMPNKQIGIYDKTLEIQEKKKDYWWDIWGLKPKQITGRVWRIECRAGKDYMKKFELRSLEDFFNQTGFIMEAILKKARYTIPNKTDSNRTRWENHFTWQRALEIIRTEFAEFNGHAEYQSVIPKLRDERIEDIKRSYKGLILSLFALENKPLETLSETAKTHFENLLESLLKDEKRVEERFLLAKNRYVHLK